MIQIYLETGPRKVAEANAGTQEQGRELALAYMLQFHMETGPRRVVEASTGTAQIRCGRGWVVRDVGDWRCPWCVSRHCGRGVESSIIGCKAIQVKSADCQWLCLPMATHRVTLGRYPRDCHVQFSLISFILKYDWGPDLPFFFKTLYLFFCYFFFGFESTQIARQLHQEHTQMEVQ